MSGSIPWLSVITFLPILVGIALAFVPKGNGEFVRLTTLTTTLTILVFSAFLVLGFQQPAPGALAYVEDHDWIPAFHIRYHLGVDGVALAMIALTALIMPISVLCSWTSVVARTKGFHISLLFLEAGMLGVFSSADLFLFYVYWEIMLVPMALLIGVWGGPRRIYAAVKFVLYTMAGSLLMFLAILYCYFAATKTGHPTLDVLELQRQLPELGLTAQILLFAAFGVSFAIKVPMFPFHTWLPDAHVEAPTAGSVILAGVLLKMGTYGFIRFAIPFFPDAALWWSPAVLALSAIGIVYGSLMCMVQTDIKKIIAYSSVAHLGFCMLGLFAGDVMAAQGAVLQMVNHGVSTGALFLLVGVIYDRAHTRGVNDFGGLAKTMPVYAVIFLIVTLSSIGLPGTNGFVGEFLILAGSFRTSPVLAAISALGVVLGAVYMLTLYRNVFFGKLRHPHQAAYPDLNSNELTTLVPLVVLIFVLGVAPNPLLALTEPAVTRVVQAYASPTYSAASEAAEGSAAGADAPHGVPHRAEVHP